MGKNFMKGLFKNGDAYIWLTGVSLMFSLLMIAGLLFLIATKALGFFWPADVVEIKLNNNHVYLGQLAGTEAIPQMGKKNIEEYRTRVKVGNRDLYGLDYTWVDDDNIVSRTYPKNAIVIERREWGNFYGFLKELNVNGNIIPGDSKKAFSEFQNLISNANKINGKIHYIEKSEIGDINYKIENLRLKLKGLQNSDNTNQSKVREIEDRIKRENAKYVEKEAILASLYKELNKNKVVMNSVEGREKTMPMGTLVRAFEPNSMGFLAKLGHYFAKLWEFVSANPREANTEGGVFPAIFGTVFMVLIMSIVVMPFGILAALYLREYSKQGFFVRLVRICVNNLAGVPSIVFGVFGVGFFLYGIGGLIDNVFYSDALPSPTFGTGGILWASLTLALLTVPVVIVATEEGLAAVPKNIKDGSLALGATKFETVWKVILPSALPAILTGLILAIARATGEVAPLMITGVVKLAPDLPIDGIFPFVHLERKFMHLGFHIYDVGFQSPNVEAAIPMVYTTALLLILIVVVLNLTAILIRNKLKKKYVSSSV
ncbi:MAG: phosphate ABC transporter permease PstA [Thermodesulfobacteriota bacterium]